MFNVDSLKNICSSLLATYKEPYISDSNRGINALLEDFVRDVYILYNKKHDTKHQEKENIYMEAVIAPFRKELKDFLDND